ncbi:MAG: mmgB [Pedosphaera sp.]|nr:mmgB [Pedosphaera sp.]
MSDQSNNQRVAVVGLGLLGRGIAACFLGHGFNVVAIDRSQEQHAEARKQLAIMMGELVELGGFNPQVRDEWTTRYTAATDFSSVKDCSFVVESVTEDIATKEAVFDSLENLLSATTVIATNTSAIPISQLQLRRKIPARFVGMHWAEPAHSTRFMELIRGEKTSDETLQTAAAMARRLGKEPCICQKDIPGFIVNRIGYAMYREALNVLQSGLADAETIDCAMRNAFGLWASVCGPLRWIDLTGGPELYAKAMQHVLPSLSNSAKLPAPMQQLAAEGARGITNGRGFYSYTPEEAHRWEELYRRHAWRVAEMHNQYFPLNKTNE